MNYTLFAGLIGLVIGSFLNVFIYRLPVMLKRQWLADAKDVLAGENSLVSIATEGEHGHETSDDPPVFKVATPGSRCPHCRTALRVMDNIPVISWLILRGRCRYCKTAISVRYPVVELAAAALSAMSIAVFGPSLAGVASCGLSLALLTLALIDFDTTLLPDIITLPLLWVGLLVNTVGAFVPLKTAVIGAVAGYLTFWLICAAFKLATGRTGMGNGDFKLLAALGAWFGWTALPAIILLSSVVGAVVGVALVLSKPKHSKQMPFGPYLAGAGLLMLFCGEPVMTLIYG